MLHVSRLSLCFGVRQCLCLTFLAHIYSPQRKTKTEVILPQIWRVQGYMIFGSIVILITTRYLLGTGIHDFWVHRDSDNYPVFTTMHHRTKNIRLKIGYQRGGASANIQKIDYQDVLLMFFNWFTLYAPPWRRLATTL